MHTAIKRRAPFSAAQATQLLLERLDLVLVEHAVTIAIEAIEEGAQPLRHFVLLDHAVAVLVPAVDLVGDAVADLVAQGAPSVAAATRERTDERSAQERRLALVDGD